MAIATGAAILGGALLSGVLGHRAASAQSNATDTATDESRRQFDTTQQNLAPYIGVGHGAIAQLGRLYGLNAGSGGSTLPPGTLMGGAGNSGRDFLYGQGMIPGGTLGGTPQAQPGTPDMSQFFTSPDYQFRQQEGQNAINRSLAARGKALSGQGVKEGQRYASGLASQEFGSYFDRLASLAGIGQTGAAQSAAAGAASASQVGNAQIYGGQARASGYANLNNSIQGGLSNYLLMQQLGQQGYRSSNPWGM